MLQFPTAQKQSLLMSGADYYSYIAPTQSVCSPWVLTGYLCGQANTLRAAVLRVASEPEFRQAAALVGARMRAHRVTPVQRAAGALPPTSAIYNSVLGRTDVRHWVLLRHADIAEPQRH